MNFSFNRDRQKTTRSPAPSEPHRAPSVVPSVTPSVASGRRTPPDDNWETLDLSSTEYARMRKEVMQLINDLRSLGAETMMDLPSIVVIGGQSAGKSSLVEAVTGVTVPRDSGTCTRCPMECTVSSSATTWSCKIKLRFDYDSFGRFAVQQKEISFGPTITDKDDIDIWLRRAQAAILNPDLIPEGFYKKSAQDLKNLNSVNSLKFSRNVVSIFIEDPNATDLSFVDLPGLIQNEDEDVVDLVRELTESYIERSNTIILTTIPMSDDMQNQQSVKLARQADPDGERTIGILTKPDTLGDGAVNAKKLWLDVIEGRQHKLKHGYYCVRLPDDAQRAQGLSRSELQRIAAEYFDAASPWNRVTDRGRFGIPAFVTDISALLVNHIKQAIPRLRQDVEQLLTSCLVDIGTLPKPLEEDPQVEVLARVNAFCEAFKSAVSGSVDKTLAQRNRALYTIFAQDVRGTSPDFRPFDNPDQYLPICAIDSEELANTRHPDSQIIGVYDVRKTIKESTGWELPNNIPYEAKTRLINQFTILWSAPAEKCLESVNEVLDDIIQQFVKTHFGRFTVLRNMVLDLMRSDIEEHKKSALDAVRETLELESAPIYSQNLNDFQDLREKWLVKYRKARRNPGDHRMPASRVNGVTRPVRPDSSGIASFGEPSPGEYQVAITEPKLSGTVKLAPSPAAPPSKPNGKKNQKAKDHQIPTTPSNTAAVPQSKTMPEPMPQFTASPVDDDRDIGKRSSLPSLFQPAQVDCDWDIYERPSPPLESAAWESKEEPQKSAPTPQPAVTPQPIRLGTADTWGGPGTRKPQSSSLERQALECLARAGYHGLTVDDLVRLSPRDQFEDELVVMADVRAYFTIACKRIIDSVPLKIHQTLHRALANRLSVSLLQRLIVSAMSTGDFAGRMQELVRDDPAIEAKRTRLEATRTRLQEMKRKLVNFTL